MGCSSSKKTTKTPGQSENTLLQNPQGTDADKQAATDAEITTNSKKALIVATSSTSMGDHRTGAWSEEICGPFYTFEDAGIAVTVCSISGGDVPIDEGSLSDSFKTVNDKRMIAAGSVPLKGTKSLKEMDISSFDIIFFAGGHGTCADFPTDDVGKVVATAISSGKVVAAVCHGPMALVKAQTADGKPLVSGKRVCCFSDAEEQQVGLDQKVPFLLESKLKELGATVEVSAPWSDNATNDDLLVTGQNPQSSISCAKLAIAAARSSDESAVTQRGSMMTHAGEVEAPQGFLQEGDQSVGNGKALESADDTQRNVGEDLACGSTEAVTEVEGKGASVCCSL